MSYQSIRRAVIASGLVIGAAAAFSPAAFAGTTGSVGLSGSVASTLAVTATATAGASALVLDGVGGSVSEHIVQVGDLSMLTNNEQGLTLTVDSGDLTKAGGSSIAFQVTTVADATTAPATGDFAIASGSNYTVGTSTAGSAAKDLYMKYTPASLQDPGAYTATINVSVADN